MVAYPNDAIQFRQHNQPNAPFEIGTVSPLPESPGRAAAREILTAPTLTPTQESYYEPYARGFNVIVQPYKSKGGLPWKNFQNARVPETDIPKLTAGRFNPAIILGAMYGAAAGTFVAVLDCETAATFEANRAAFRQRGIPLDTVRTGGNKCGGHIYFRTAQPLESIEPGEMRDIELRAENTRYVLSEGATHPDGGIYQRQDRETDLPPLIDPVVIDWLTDVDGLPVTLTTKGQHKPHTLKTGLSSKTQAYLQHGHTLTEWRNDSMFKAACDLAGNGYSQSEAESLLLPIVTASGKDEKSSRRSIASAYSREREPSRKNTGSGLFWQHGLHLVESQNWTGRTANSDRKTAYALVERCRLGAYKNGTFRASARETAELAGLTGITASKAIHRLIDRYRILEFAGMDKASGANLYRFSSQTKVGKTNTLRTTISGTSSSVLKFPISPCAERGALGVSGWCIYQALLHSDRPLNKREIAAAANVTYEQVRYALRPDGYLCAAELVKNAGRNWTAQPATDQQLNERVAIPSGAITRREKRTARHIAERGIRGAALLYAARLKTDALFRSLMGDTPLHEKRRQDAPERARTHEKPAHDVQTECTPETAPERAPVVAQIPQPEHDPVAQIPQGAERDPLAAWAVAELGAAIGDTAQEVFTCAKSDLHSQKQGALTHV